MVDLDTKLLTNEAAGTLATEQVLGAYILDDVGIQALQVDLNRVLSIRAIVLESNDGPWPLDSCAGLLNFIQEHALDLALVNQGGERVAGVNETGATRPAASAADARAVTLGIPESNVIDLGRLVSHDRALQPKVAQDLGRSRLDTVGATSSGRHWAVVDVLHLVTPS